MPIDEPATLRLPSDLARITHIGDSVFAVALTLLATGVHLPPDLVGRHLTPADLLPMLDDMGAIALSFCVASVFWLSHWVHLRHAVRTTVPFLIANLALLLCIVLLPISTRLLAAGPLSAASAAVYGGNLFAASLALLVFRQQAVLLSVPIGETPPPTRVPRHIASYYALTLHATGFAMAFVNPRLTIGIWMFTLTTPLVEAWVNRTNARSPAG